VEENQFKAFGLLEAFEETAKWALLSLFGDDLNLHL